MKRFLNSITLPADKRPGLALLLLALFLGVTAQIVLILSLSDESVYWNIAAWFKNISNNSSPVLGLGLYTLAGILFILGLRQLGMGKLAPIEAFSGLREKLPPRFGFWLTSLGLALFTAYYTSQPEKAIDNGYTLAFLWILSIGLFAYSLLRQSGWKWPARRALLDWMADNRYELIGVIAILVVALVARTVNLELHPYSMVNDEGEMGKGALCLLNGTCRNIFAIAWASQPLVPYLPYALSVAILGNTAALPIRLVSVVTGMLAILFTYLFVREAFGKKTALIAGILLATFPYHVHFSRLGVDNIADSLSSSLLLWLLYRGMRKGTVGYFLAAGIVIGLCLYIYPGSRLVAATGTGMLVYAILTQRGFFRAQFSNLLVLALAAFITAAPILGTYAADGSEFNARMNSVGLLQTGVLDAEIQQTGLNAAQIIVREFFKSSLPFIATSGPLNFFDTPRAYLSTIAAVFLMLGLALAFWKMFDLRNIVLLVWFFAPIIIGSALTAGAPSNQRMLGSSPAAVILAAIALVTLLEGLQNAGDFLRRLAPIILIAALLYNGYQDLNFYFGEYRTGHYFEDLSNEITYESHTYIAQLDGAGRFYLIGDPMTFTVFGNFGYFAPNIEKMDLKEVTPETLAALPKDKDALFLAIPYREPDLRNIENWIPGGQWIAENRRYRSDQPLFFIYKVTKEQLQAYHP
jgi:hypothetical protein